MPRRVTWIILIALLLTPVLGSVSVSRPAFAQDEATVEATNSPVDESPTSEATPEFVITGEASPVPEETLMDVPVATDTATETPTATNVPTETPTADPTSDGDGNAAVADVGTTDDISVVLKCTTAPAESIRVTNNGAADIDLISIGTLLDPLLTEPFAVTRTLKPGRTALFQAGPGAQYGTVLTTEYIFTDAAYELDGVSIETSAGTVTKACNPAPTDPWITNPGALSDISVTLNCRAYAETIRVTNNGTGYILLKTLATDYDPLTEEPFQIGRVLKPGKTAIYQAGTGAKYGTVLTLSYIFTNSVWDKDGVRISTSAGKVRKSCDPKPLPPEHWVEINLSTQFLRAWEGDKVVNSSYVSTGRPGFDTPTGTFRILVKYRYDDMEGVINGEYYNVPAVPWTMYFTNYGHALHGAYWHNNFGQVMSHGCVNLPLGFAEWLYYWLPYGGRVVIHY